MRTTRRLLVTQLGAVALAAPALAATPTPPETAGPFYPVSRTGERDADMTRLIGRRARAKGQIVEVTGRVLNASGAPLSNAKIEIWQANAAGRYAHPRDTSIAPLDPDFQGYAVLTTDADGRYRLTTVKPGAYATGPGGLRTPHLHVKLTRGAKRLTTQMYFPGEALNDTDRLLNDMRRSGGKASALIAQAGVARENGALAFQWDVVLAA